MPPCFMIHSYALHSSPPSQPLLPKPQVQSTSICWDRTCREPVWRTSRTRSQPDNHHRCVSSRDERLLRHSRGSSEARDLQPEDSRVRTECRPLMRVAPETQTTCQLSPAAPLGKTLVTQYEMHKNLSIINTQRHYSRRNCSAGV